MPGCIRDYRQWLAEQGVDTAGMRPMGHAESVMSRFEHRVKSRRSWKDQGLRAFLHVMIAEIDGMSLMNRPSAEKGKPAADRPASASTKAAWIKTAKRRVRRLWPEMVRDNVPYLQHSSGTPIHQALSELR